MSEHNLLLAYFSPETLLPVTSIVAAVVGVVLMFGRNTFRLIGRYCRHAILRPARIKIMSKNPPHFRYREESHSYPVRR